VPDAISFIFLFAFGTIIGSFLNVATLRYQPEGRLFDVRDISGRSRCPSCRTTLRWFDLIPLISFLLLRGRCRSCHARLSPQYPLVEAAGGAIAAGIPFLMNSFYGVSAERFFSLEVGLWYYGLIALWVAITFAWLTVTVIDARHAIIPNGLNLGIGILGAGVTALLVFGGASLPPFHSSFLAQYQLVFSPFSDTLANHILGSVVAGCLFWALSLFSRGRAMGLGDVKLAFASGLALGWPDVGLAIALSFLAGGFWGTFLLISKRRRFGDHVPFGPFLVLGSVLTVCIGLDVVQWYFSLFSLS
jgi:prepilin signal peptidase PulO-like enzyme (type II secretory pathway)